MQQPTLIIAGDLSLMGRTLSLSIQQLLPLLQDVKPILKSAEASLVNLETAILKSFSTPIKKSGPTIATDSRLLEVIGEIGFTGVTLANNHFADYGDEGVKESLQLLDEYKLWHVGAGVNADEAAEIKYLQVSDKKVAVINACEHEFTIATADTPGCNALNPIRQYAAIQEAKKNADYIVLIIHGGVEHYQFPTPRMQETYRFFIDAGADAVINHHQHCYSGYEIYKGRPIVYGLGNFFFDWQGQDANWNEGYMVKLTFGKEIGLELIPYIQNTGALGIELMEGVNKDNFFASIDKFNAIISSPEQLQAHFCSWVDQKREEYIQLLQPTIGKNVRRLDWWHLIPKSQRANWMPEYLTDERRLLLKSLFQCESHQEVMNEIFKCR